MTRRIFLPPSALAILTADASIVGATGVTVLGTLLAIALCKKVCKVMMRLVKVSLMIAWLDKMLRMVSNSMLLIDSVVFRFDAHLTLHLWWLSATALLAVCHIWLCAISGFVPYLSLFWLCASLLFTAWLCALLFYHVWLCALHVYMGFIGCVPAPLPCFYHAWLCALHLYM